MAKPKTRHTCTQCGWSAPRWQGRCDTCGEWNTLVEETVAATPVRGLGAASVSTMGAANARPRPVTEIPARSGPRDSTGVPEFDRVLGGGVVPGALVLIAGDPGTGKSTLLTRVAGNVAETGGVILYVSGEESVEQIKLRAGRLSAEHDALWLASETDVATVADHVERLSPKLLIIDSIQTMQVADVDSVPGSVSQVRAATGALAALAKGRGLPTFLVGHVTKEGAIAGPRVLEHMVDTVLYFEGDARMSHRILRAVKNRFGSTDEIGVFEMREDGLAEVGNPSAAFLAERPVGAPGSVVAAAVEGTRALLVEVQALVAPSPLAAPRRVANGVSRDRVSVVLAVLEKRLGLSLANQDVYVSVAGGVRVEEPALDLAIALAVASSLLDRPLAPDTVVLGEVGLSGEVRSVSQPGKRLVEAARMGFRRAVMPRRNASGDALQGGIVAAGVEEVRDAVAALLGAGEDPR